MIGHGKPDPIKATGDLQRIIFHSPFGLRMQPGLNPHVSLIRELYDTLKKTSYPWMGRPEGEIDKAQKLPTVNTIHLEYFVQIYFSEIGANCYMFDFFS